MKYAVITPAKNESRFIGVTLRSVAGQSLLPTHWIIVDDGSEDGTGDIVQKFSRDHPWITLVRYEADSSARAGGEKVVRVVNFGLRHLPAAKYDAIVKLDADLDLPADYFEKVSGCFAEDAQVGLCGGRLVNVRSGKRMLEAVAEYHVRGALKTYRWDCFSSIGGLPQTHNWDGLDEMKAMSLGWKVRVLPLEVVHLRPTGRETNAGLRSAFRSGREYYRDGNDVLIAGLRSCAVGVRTSPPLLSGVVFFAGFLKGFISRDQKNVDETLERFVRSFQYRRIGRLLGRVLRRVRIGRIPDAR